ncbi:hypothetical protein C8J57DRAFT_1354700 [Mycena rebaudengoi]|nr:hypothetical protein C8J57DRAFT_1354700 [Mycena rebaudengoi]
MAWTSHLVPDSPALRPRAPIRPGLALTPNVVLVPCTNIAAWVRALGRLCIVVTGAGLEMSTYRRLQMCPSPRASFSSRRVPRVSVLCSLPRASRCVSSPRMAHRQSRRRKEVAGGDGISGRRPLGRGSRVGMSQASGTPALSDNGGRKRDGDVRRVGRSNEGEECVVCG